MSFFQAKCALMLNQIIRFFLYNKLITLLVLVILAGWGIVTAPFDWQIGWLPRDPVPVDAIPDIGENQQIVFTEWPGRSPQDVEDQITYPLTTSLLGIPGVKTVRSTSMFGFSSIYVIFDEEVEFYWSRSRILEKLNSLPPGLLPAGVQAVLGPDATALGQIFWYTLEGRDKHGQPTGGWDLHELRTVQDFYVKYALNAVEGVSEVASIGGFVQEYQVDVKPEALKAFNVGLDAVVMAVKNSNRDVGAKTLEINQAEYLVRGLGYIKSLADLEESVVTVAGNTPVRIKDLAVVSLGPAERRGILDKSGAEVAGGVVVARYGSNPLQVINDLKEKIREVTPGLPSKVLADGTVSQLTIVPFYDRSTLIHETLGTLEEALNQEVIITILVIVVMVLNLRASILISSLLPVAILITFIAMRYAGVDANIVALSGIAIAIGTMVDLGIILSENIISHLEEESHKAKLEGRGETKLIDIVYRASAEVSSAIVTAVSTTIISFIPVFTMEAAEGKLFRPLAFTKTFALAGAVLVTLVILPALSHWLFGLKLKARKPAMVLHAILAAAGVCLLIFTAVKWAGFLLLGYAAVYFVRAYTSRTNRLLEHGKVVVTLAAVTWLLAKYWLPLGAGRSLLVNYLFVVAIVGGLLAFFQLIVHFYEDILAWCLRNKLLFLSIPTVIFVSGLVIWLGFSSVFGFVATALDVIGINIRTSNGWSVLTHKFPGTGEEFMPSLDEGSFLLMPTSMPHSGVDENRRILQQLDMAVTAIPEVKEVVGKAGRSDSALDPAPISMFENVINYKSEYLLNEKGHRLRFRRDDEGNYVLKNGDKISRQEVLSLNLTTDDLQQDPGGEYLRQWRDHIRSPDDIWREIVAAANLPGVTSAPKLQPIETRLVMLQTGMRAPMGIKVKGPDLSTIEAFGLKLERYLKEVPSVKAEAVFADRIVGKPYLHLNINRESAARYGLTVEAIQQTIEAGIGGMPVTTTVEGRERYAIRVRYPRELRNSPEALQNLLVPTPAGVQIPLGHLLDLEYVQGPQMIKSEDTFLVGYVLFDKKGQYAEVEVVEEAAAYIQGKIDSGELTVPAGVSYRFSGSYENQVRAEKRLVIIIPLVLVIIFLILYFQFRRVSTSLFIFSGVAVAFAGAFIMIWLYGQPWFLNFDLFGVGIRETFQISPVNLSVAVWVGFIALFGVTTDDGVVMGTYLDQSFGKNKPATTEQVRAAVIEAGKRRIRPCLMTTATTIIALLPVLTSTGRGSDIMVPMAIPSVGGMTIEIISIFIVPVLYCWQQERKLRKANPNNLNTSKEAKQDEK